MRKTTLSVLAAVILGSALEAAGTNETLAIIGDDLKTGMSYKNIRYDFGGKKSMYFNTNFNKELITYIKPDNYFWNKEKLDGQMHQKLNFPDTSNYAWLERVNIADEFHFSKIKDTDNKYFLVIDGGACVGDYCMQDENIISAVIPKRFKIEAYEAYETHDNSKYDYNKNATVKIMDNTITFYAKNMKGAYLKLWLEDTSSVSQMYKDVSSSLEQFEDITVSASETETTISMPMDNVFDSGKAVAKPIGKEWLRALVEAIRDKHFKEIRVEGHTDNTPIKGTYPSNWELSTARASDAVRFMIANGIEADKIAAVGYADTRPVADNDSKENKAKNRRIEIRIVGNPDNAEPSGAEPEKTETKVEPLTVETKKAANADECDALGGKWQWNGTINDMECV